MNEASNSVRVLIVEDNPILREELDFQLTCEGFDVRTANDATDMARHLDHEPCDVLLLDINLPEENGFSIASRLANRERLGMGIILISARDQLHDRLEGLASGADLYLVKPVDRRELVACIHTLVRRIQPRPARRPGAWTFRKNGRELQSPDGRTLSLTVQDTRVFLALLARAGETCSRSEVVAALGIDFLDHPDGRTNTTMSRLRNKLVKFDADLRIVAWRNAGYAYVGPAVQVLADETQAPMDPLTG